MPRNNLSLNVQDNLPLKGAPKMRVTPIGPGSIPGSGNAVVIGKITGDAASLGRWYDRADGKRLYNTQGATNSHDSSFGRTATAQVGTADADLAVTLAGKGLRVKEGSNAKQGVSTLVAGTVVVSNTSVTANSRIFLTINTPGGTPGWLQVSARTAGTSFTILSSNAADTSVVAWQIFEPA